MSGDSATPTTALSTEVDDEEARQRRIRLVPRYQEQGYRRELVSRRRAWVEDVTGAELRHAGAISFDSEALRGNIENPIGVAQMPLGVAGPLRVRGRHADGTFYVPLATTEGALVRSYERGMVALTRAGGAATSLYRDENRVTPVFCFPDVGAAATFVRRLPAVFEEVRDEAESTTRHGRLLALTPLPLGRKVLVEFAYSTGDAQGMNMIAKATDHACRWLLDNLGGRRYYVMSGHGSEKRASGALLRGGKGKKVSAGCRLPRGVVQAVLHTTPEELVELWQHTVLGHLQAGALGYNGHYANGLTALFIATGQDVANVANSSVGITHFELAGDDLYASINLMSLSVATVGGGTGLGSSRECLEMIGCRGDGTAAKLAEIVAATLLAGELSMGAAIASGEFVAAHETYGRNRPPEAEG